MSDTTNAYAVATLRRGGRAAAKVLLDADPLGRATDEAEAAREAVRSDPGAALAVINQSSTETGLTLAGRWRSLETTVGLIGNDTEAAELLVDHVRSDDLVDLLRIGGDLPGAAAGVVPKDVLFAALFGELDDDFGTDTEADAFIERIVVLERWAHHLKDRPDYADILASEVAGDWTVKHLLVAGLALRHGIRLGADDEDDRNAESIPYGVLADVGLDTEDLDELFAELRRFNIADFDAATVASVHGQLAARRAQLQQPAAFVAPAIGGEDDL